MFKVRFTATVINPDTEEEFNGWVSPKWSAYTLYTDRDDVEATEFETLPEAVEFIESEIGATEHDAGSESYYAADVDSHILSGENWYRAGHIEEL